MDLKRLALLVLFGVLVGITIFWVPGRFADSSGQEEGAPAASSSPAGSPQPGSADPSADPSATDPTAGSTSGSSPEAATEALPEAASTESQGGLPGLTEKPRTRAAALVTEPLPKQAVSKGTLVAGYPAALTPPARTTVGVSSVSPTPGVLQVALTATCRQPCDVLRHFRTRLAGHGFEEVATASVENVPAASFQRGEESVSITVTRTGRRTVDFSLFSVLRTVA